MAKYRKKPVVVEAVQWGGFNKQVVIPEVKHYDAYFENPYDCEHCDNPMGDHGWIETLEGGHIVCPGDWIIKGTAGEFYPCKEAIFPDIYEPA
jgi:hypothetical protein